MENLIIESENVRQGIHGSVESVPTRNSGNNEPMFDERRQRYGETERYTPPVKAENSEILLQPNITLTPNNPTRNSQINGTFQLSSTQ